MAERCQSTSAPAQKLSPSPASRTARASPTSAKASVSSRISAASKAFRRSGRASVTRSSGPSRSTRSTSMVPELKVGPVLRGALAAAVLRRLRDSAENFVGLKVSDRPWERFEPYLIEGLDVFVGPESLIERGLAGGAVGVVSGLATAFPAEVSAAVRGVPGPNLEALRDGLEQFPFHAAAKRVLRRRRLPIREDVRAPLRELTEDERQALDQWLASS